MYFVGGKIAVISFHSGRQDSQGSFKVKIELNQS